MYRALLFERNVDNVIRVAREQFAAARQVEQKREQQTEELWESFGLSADEVKSCTPSQRALLKLAAQTLQAEATRGPLDDCTFPSVLSNLIFEYSSS